jgi:hypothetical protein
MTTPADDAPVRNRTPAEDVQPTDTPDEASQTGESNDSPELAPPAAEPNPNSEAARYRVQLREAESARDALAERVRGYQRRECEAVVANLLDVPGDLWEIGQADVSTFYNDQGELNETELQAAAGALIDQRPRLAKPQGPRHQNFGQFAGRPPGRMSWDAVIKEG